MQSSISYTLGANVENLTLTGTATSTAPATPLANTLTGNAGDNVLDGGAGNDTHERRRRQRHLRGRRGRRRGDRARRTRAPTRSRAAISYTLGANVENLTLTGTADINGTGNTLQQHARPAMPATTSSTAAPATTP